MDAQMNSQGDTEEKYLPKKWKDGQTSKGISKQINVETDRQTDRQMQMK